MPKVQTEAMASVLCMSGYLRLQSADGCAKSLSIKNVDIFAVSAHLLL